MEATYHDDMTECSVSGIVRLIELRANEYSKLLLATCRKIDVIEVKDEKEKNNG